MTIFGRVRDEFSTWITSVAEAIVSGSNRLGAQQQVRLLETDPNCFVLRTTARPRQPAPAEQSFMLVDDEPDQDLRGDWKATLRGSRLDIRLRPQRFLFRPLDLPRRASDFLDAMIRSQVDRLTPWTANEAVFSWSAPVETAADRIRLTVVAAPKTKVMPLIRLAETWSVGSVTLYAGPDDGPAATSETKVFEKRMRGALDVAPVRRILTIVLLVVGVAAALSLVVADVVGGQLDLQQQQLSRRISERRAAMRANAGNSGDSAQMILARRKQNSPSSVMVLESLSEILPDNTHVTEFRVEKDKLQVVGITQDAPSLVRLLEQSPQFTRVTFFAPTTRSQNDPGERFHVEARLKPYFGPSP